MKKFYAMLLALCVSLSALADDWTIYIDISNTNWGTPDKVYVHCAWKKDDGSRGGYSGDYPATPVVPGGKIYKATFSYGSTYGMTISNKSTKPSDWGANKQYGEFTTNNGEQNWKMTSGACYKLSSSGQGATVTTSYSEPTLTGYKLKGSWDSGWTEKDLTKSGDNYTISNVEITNANAEFGVEQMYDKSVNGNKNYIWYNASSATTINASGEYNCVIESSSSSTSNFKIDQGTYDFSYNPSTTILTVTKHTENGAVTGVTLNKTSLTLTEGETETLTATVAPANATDKTVTWTTSNDKVATVANGVVTAVAAGSATITATAGGKTATCAVTVNASVVTPAHVVALVGDKFGWSVAASEYKTSTIEDNKAVLVVENWPGGAFKMVHNDTFYSVKGAEQDGQTMGDQIEKDKWYNNMIGGGYQDNMYLPEDANGSNVTITMAVDAKPPHLMITWSKTNFTVNDVERTDVCRLYVACDQAPRIWMWEDGGAGGETVLGVKNWDNRPTMDEFEDAEYTDDKTKKIYAYDVPAKYANSKLKVKLTWGSFETEQKLFADSRYDVSRFIDLVNKDHTPVPCPEAVVTFASTHDKGIWSGDHKVKAAFDVNTVKEATYTVNHSGSDQVTNQAVVNGGVLNVGTLQNALATVTYKAVSHLNDKVAFKGSHQFIIAEKTVEVYSVCPAGWELQATFVSQVNKDHTETVSFEPWRQMVDGKETLMGLKDGDSYLILFKAEVPAHLIYGTMTLGNGKARSAAARADATSGYLTEVPANFTTGKTLYGQSMLMDGEGIFNEFDPTDNSQTTGVDSVIANADASEAVYYNLQGQRVANPQGGVFIRVQSGKATKVAL